MVGLLPRIGAPMIMNGLLFFSVLLFPLLGILVGKAVVSYVPDGFIPYCFLGIIILFITVPAAVSHLWMDKNYPSLGFNLGITEGLCGGSLIWFVTASLINFKINNWENWGLLLLGVACLVVWYLHRRNRNMRNRKTQLPGMLLGFLLSPIYLLLLLVLGFHRPLGG